MLFLILTLVCSTEDGIESDHYEEPTRMIKVVEGKPHTQTADEMADIFQADENGMTDSRADSWNVQK